MITINQVPQLFTPAYNPIVFTLSSTNYAQSNFQFICDVYINGSATRSARIKLPPHPTNTYAYVDISGVVQSYISQDADAAVYWIKKNSNSILSYQCQFGEEYGASSGIITYPNLATSGVYYAINASIEDHEFVDWNQDDYLISSSSSMFLTNSPRSFNMSSGQRHTLSYIVNTSNKAYEVLVRSFDSDGNTLNSVTIPSDYPTIAATDEKHIRIGIGMKELSELTIGEITSGTLPAIPANAYKYIVYVRSNTTAQTSEQFTFYVITRCNTRFTPYLFTWLNKLGGYDCFYFEGSISKVANIERKFFKKAKGEWSGTSFSYTKQQRANNQYANNSKDKYTARSNWITEAESDWLSELLDSPDVYLFNDNDEMIPVNIISSSFDFKTDAKDRLFNLEIEYELDFVRHRQNR